MITWNIKGVHYLLVIKEALEEYILRIKRKQLFLLSAGLSKKEISIFISYSHVPELMGAFEAFQKKFRDYLSITLPKSRPAASTHQKTLKSPPGISY